MARNDTNQSGHYRLQAGLGLTDSAKQFLANRGVDVSNAAAVEVLLP